MVNTVKAFQILAASVVFRCLYKVPDEVAAGCGAVYERAWRQVLYAAAVIVGVIAMSSFGIVGVAAAVAFAIAMNCILMMNLAMRVTKVGVPYLVRRFIPGMIIGLIRSLFVISMRYRA